MGGPQCVHGAQPFAQLTKGPAMTPQFAVRPLLATTLALAALLAFPTAQAANLSKADYDAGKTRLSADYKTEKAACATLAANAKDICVEAAKAHE